MNEQIIETRCEKGKGYTMTSFERNYIHNGKRYSISQILITFANGKRLNFYAPEWSTAKMFAKKYVN